MATSLQCHARDQILSRYSNQLAAIGAKAPIAMRDTLNREGDRGRTRIKRAMVGQTKLPKRTIDKAVKTFRADRNRLLYELRTAGGEVSLKYFGPRELRAGVKHRSPKRESVIRSGFTKGGSFKKGRKAIHTPVSLGHVWTRQGGGKWPLHKEKSGVWIPKEMIAGDSRMEFNAISFKLADTLGKQIARYLPQ